MHACAHVCVCVCAMYVYVYTCVYMFVYVYMYICIYMCMCECTCVYVWVGVCRAIHVCVCCMTASTRQTTPHEAMIDRIPHHPYPAEPETGTRSGPRFWDQIWSQKREPVYLRLFGTGSGSQNWNHVRDQGLGRSLVTDGRVTRLRPARACSDWFPFLEPEF